MRTLAAALALLSLGFPALPGQTSSVLYGDFEIEGIPEGADAPAVFHILLLNRGLHVVGKETVGPRGRYRFLEVPNGEFYIVVQAEETELVRMYFRMDEIRSTDVRKDIRLQWSEAFDARPEVDERLAYARSRSNQNALDKARKQSQKGKVREAAKLLERLIESDPEDFEAWTELGTAHFQENRLKAAQESYERAVDLRPDYTPALVNLAKVHFSQKAYEPAAELFRQALDSRADLAESHYLLAETYLQLKKGSLAVQHFEKSLEIDPVNMSDAHLRMAMLYRAAGWNGQAAAQYRDFLEKQPDHPARKDLEAFIAEHKEASP